MKLSLLNTKDKAQFLDTIGGSLEGEAWLAERIIGHRPFATISDLIVAFETVINHATQEEKIKLISSHPDLAPKVDATLSKTSQKEQKAAGLTSLSPAEFDRFQRLNTQYHETFGFPFVICAREHTKDSILEHFEARLANTRDQEIDIGIAEVIKIIRLRTLDLIEPMENNS